MLEHRREPMSVAGTVAGEYRPAVVGSQRQMNVARAARALVVFRHEGQAHALVGSDLFGTGLVDAVVVTGDQGLVVYERDLVLAEVALALGRLDPHAGAVHTVADASQHRLYPRRAEQRVVDVVLVG